MPTEHEEYTLDGVEELPPEEDAKVKEMIAQSERDWEESHWGKNRRVIFDWRELHLEAVVRAAEMMGVTWQEYIKQAALRQALVDLAAARNLERPDAAKPAGAAGGAQPGSAQRVPRAAHPAPPARA